ncbi:MAG: MATE family efflux transporter, partial [Oscillospiraceae bacterium]|nr:MATE family efflux transporter [Oscillospiraceae bacterium]
MNKYFEFGNRSFIRRTVLITLPVILQQLISIGINFMDNLMIGGFGETQISAAAFGNQFYAILQFICMGLGSGVVVMSSQFWGSRDHKSMRISAAMGMRVTLAICAAFTIFSVSAPHIIMRIFTNDEAIIAAGTPYMRLIGATFLLAGLSSTATYLLRSVGNVRIAFIGSAISFFVNIFFNWVFIFGKLGAPR